jgi:hypothetical protein
MTFHQNPFSSKGGRMTFSKYKREKKSPVSPYPAKMKENSKHS